MSEQALLVKVVGFEDVPYISTCPLTSTKPEFEKLPGFRKKLAVVPVPLIEALISLVKNELGLANLITFEPLLVSVAPFLLTKFAPDTCKPIFTPPLRVIVPKLLTIPLENIRKAASEETTVGFVLVALMVPLLTIVPLDTTMALSLYFETVSVAPLLTVRSVPVVEEIVIELATAGVPD